MSPSQDENRAKKQSPQLNAKLASYLASTAAVGVAASENADADIIAHTTPIPFGVNSEIPIDFNNDGIAEFQIDHDRVNLNGVDLDYLQLDKNDATGEHMVTGSDINNFPSADADSFLTFQTEYGLSMVSPRLDSDRDKNDFVGGGDLLELQKAFGKTASRDVEYLAFLTEPGNMSNQVCDHFGSGGCHPAALESGFEIGPAQSDLAGNTTQYMFSESENAFGQGGVIRPNRLIDEDMGQLDEAEGLIVEPPLSDPEFVGLNGETRYIGVRMDLNDAGFPGNEFAGANGPDNIDDPANYWYGWIGVQITNEADATGVITGFAYEDQLGTPIRAGDDGTGGLSVVPEPGALVLVVAGSAAVLSRVFVTARRNR